MKIVADEGVDSAVVKILRTQHQVLYIAELSPSISDDAVLELANTQQALLITEDKDFGELVFRLERVHHGIILLRLHELDSDVKANLTEQAVKEYGDEMRDAFSVISSKSVRIRSRA